MTPFPINLTCSQHWLCRIFVLRGITCCFEQVTFDSHCEVLSVIARKKLVCSLDFFFCAWKAAEPW